MTADSRSGYTSHGHWYGPGEPTEPKPTAVARCGGPGMCRGCRKEAGLHAYPRPFSRETDLTPRTGVGGPVTSDDILFLHRLSNPERSDLERIIRADERRRVAEEIAAAIEAAGRDPLRNLAWMYPEQAAAIAREFATKGAEQ